MPSAEIAEVAHGVPHGDKLRALNEHQNFSLGLVTGALDQAIAYPIMFWKNSYIQGRPFTMSPRIVYRGTATACLNQSTLAGIQFISSGYLQKVVAGDLSNHMTWGQEVTCAFLGGAISGPVCCAYELTMIQQQMHGGSMLGTVSRIVQSHGLLGLTRGLTGSVGREAFFAAGYLGCLPALQKYIREHAPSVSPEAAQGAGTIAAGLLCGAITQPMDTAKTCMQGDLLQKKYGGTVQTLRTLVAQYGSVQALYRGYRLRSAQLIVEFFILDNLSKKMAPIMFPEKFGHPSWSSPSLPSLPVPMGSVGARSD